MISLEKVLAELKSESVNEIVGGVEINIGDICICLFDCSCSTGGTSTNNPPPQDPPKPPETPQQPDAGTPPDAGSGSNPHYDENQLMCIM